MRVSNQSLVESLQRETRLIIEETQNILQQIDAQGLWWRASPKEWGIGDCLAHLVYTNDFFFPRIQKAVKYSFEKGYPVYEYYRPGLIGSRLSRQMLKTRGFRRVKFRFFTVPWFNPSWKKPDKLKTVIKFRDQMSYLIHLIGQVKDLPLDKVKIQSTTFIYYLSLGDTLEFIVNHARRHLLQADRIFKLDNFPKKDEPLFIQK